MPTNILMPALSPTMTEGNLAKWLKSEGDTVEAGDVIAEIETDKATMEVEAVDEGIIGKILIAEGTESVAVNAVIAVLLEEGESADDIGDVSAEAPAPVVESSNDNRPRVTASPAQTQAEGHVIEHSDLLDEQGPVLEPPPLAPAGYTEHKATTVGEGWREAMQ